MRAKAQLRQEPFIDETSEVKKGKRMESERFHFLSVSHF